MCLEFRDRRFLFKNMSEVERKRIQKQKTKQKLHKDYLFDYNKVLICSIVSEEASDSV